MVIDILLLCFGANKQWVMQILFQETFAIGGASVLER